MSTKKQTAKITETEDYISDHESESIDDESVGTGLTDDEGDDFADEPKEPKLISKDDDEAEEVEEAEEAEEETGEDEGNDFDEESDQDTSCVYNIKVKSRKTKKYVEHDDDIIQGDDDAPPTLLQGVVKPEDRITKPYMTKYERVRILGVRCKQLILGAKPLIKKYAQLSPREIADLELKHGVIPFIIIRELPSGLQEHWKVSELTILN